MQIRYKTQNKYKQNKEQIQTKQRTNTNKTKNKYKQNKEHSANN